MGKIVIDNDAVNKKSTRRQRGQRGNDDIATRTYIMKAVTPSHNLVHRAADSDLVALMFT